VRESDGAIKTVGSLPILFVGVGPCAEKTLAQFSETVRSLAIPVQGPFGLLLLDPLSQELFTWDWLRITDFEIPESRAIHERSESVGNNDARLQTSVSSLVRRLRSVEPAADSASPGRIRLNSYAVIDLSAAEAVGSALRVAKALRQADPAQDMTILGLTARTAVTDAACDSEWFEAWKLLLAQLQEAPFAQRVYLLDGCDSDKTWFERPEQLHRLGAEFLLHHGLTCRALLRQNERARTGPGESLLNVCGSFGCRMIPANLPAAAERIAERLAREDLADLYHRTVPGGWLESVEEQAQSLVERMAGICEKAGSARPGSPSERRDRPGGSLVANAELAEAIAKTIKHVCSRESLVSLCHFFKCLQPRFGKLLTRQRLWERTRTHRLAVEAFRQQYDSTYGPMRVWLSEPETRWEDRFTPRQDKPSRAAVSLPVGMKSYLAGCAFFVLGLACIAAGLFWRDPFFVIGGGWVALASSVLMTLPTGWVLRPRNRMREGQEIAPSIPLVRYRRRASERVLFVAGMLIVVGLPGVTWSLWPEVWTFATTMGAVALAVLAGAGAALIAGCPTGSHKQQASTEEAPRHANPPLWHYRAVGRACLALAWMVLWLGAPAQTVAYTTVQGIIHLAGLLLVGAGVVLASFPRVGRTYLVDRMPRIPQPLAGGIGRQAGENELGHRIAAMASWVGRVALEADGHPQRSGATDRLRDGETIFDFCAADWDSQLAEAVRRELKARSDKTLKTLALQPVLWSECVTKEFQDPRTGCPDLTSLFALQAVKAWIESYTLAELLSFLKIDIARFERLTGRLASPHWPAPRAEPNVNANIIVVGKPLWEVLAPLTQVSGTPPLVQLDWDPQGGTILALRAVQGLAQGWRGFPGLPGQRQDGMSKDNERKGPPGRT